MTDSSDQSTARNELVGAQRARITEMAEASRLTDVEFEALRVVHPLTRNKATLAAFNELLQQLLQHRERSNFVVAVTGLEREVGCSYVALNLAATIATELRHTSLLIQCNPHPTVLNRMMVPFPEIGMMDYLGDPQMDINNIVYAPGVARMRAIPYGGRRFDARLLGSQRMEQMIDAARSRYSDRFIVMDLPAAVNLGQARSILDWVDMTILVVPYGSGTTEAVRPAVTAIGEERLTGLLMNWVPG